MTSAVLYGTTSDNELRPVQVTDSGEFVTDGGGGGDWYANFYVGGTEGAPSISLLSDGTISATGDLLIAGNPGGGEVGIISSSDGFVSACRDNATVWNGYEKDNGTATSAIHSNGDVYARNFIDSDGYDLGKIGQALSTIYDVIESVDDFQGLKNLFHLLLDNLKSDPTPPVPPIPPIGT